MQPQAGELGMGEFHFGANSRFKTTFLVDFASGGKAIYIVLELPSLIIIAHTAYVLVALFHTHRSYFVIQVTWETSYVS